MADVAHRVDALSKALDASVRLVLTRREAALLAACLPHPLRSNPGRPSGYLSRRASTIQGRMGTYGSVAKREDDKIVMVEGKNKKYIKMVEEENLFDFAIWMLEHRSK